MKFGCFFYILPIVLVIIPSPIFGTDKNGTCAPLRDLVANGVLTEEQLLLELTNPCRYDKNKRPQTLTPITIQVDINHLEEVQQVQFTAFMTVQYTYNDPRLAYAALYPDKEILNGEMSTQDLIWIPHLVISNGKDSNRLGIDKNDLYITLKPNGNVTYTQRISSVFYCWMNLEKFPFDSQQCLITWKSWNTNTDFMRLHWEDELPVRISNNLHLTEFVLDAYLTYERAIDGPFPTGPLSGQFSELVFEFRLHREVGYYMMCFFLPSILLVCTSWVTFWLQADAGPPRATLGSSTVIAFITLNGGLVKDLPKISYVKASDVWFLAISFFIFASLAEFAFVNVIWRRKKPVEMEKADSRNILAGAFLPKKFREQVSQVKNSRNSLYKAESFTVLDPPCYNDLQLQNERNEEQERRQKEEEEEEEEQSWHTMTPQEVAIWVDRKARFVFPLAFIVFNIFYWSFVILL